jgi:hypothetical protein
LGHLDHGRICCHLGGCKGSNYGLRAVKANAAWIKVIASIQSPLPVYLGVERQLFGNASIEAPIFERGGGFHQDAGFVRIAFNPIG